jgi:hypothetical protein
VDETEKLKRRYRHLQTPPKVGGPADDMAPTEAIGPALQLADRYRKH